MENTINTNKAEQLADVAGAQVGVSGNKALRSLSKLTNLTPNVFFTDILDTINLSKNPFDVFVRQDVMYGDKVRYVSTGIIDSKEYGMGKYTPDQMGSVVAPDYEDYSTSFVKSTYPLIYNEVEMTYYFKNFENLSTFMNQVRGVNTTSYEKERLESFLYLFGNNDVTLPSYVKTELDKTKAKIKNVQDLGTKTDMKDVFVELVKLAQNMGAQGKTLSKEYNIGFTKGSSTGAKMNKSVMSEDLVLIISHQDLLDLGKEAANIYHQDFYNGERKFYKVIEADIPKGTCYILDKQAIRVYPKIQRSIANEWMDLSTSLTSHVFAYWGVFKYANGVKVTFTIG